MNLLGTQVGPYQIQSPLGEGGFGCVFKGEHPVIGRQVAIKILLPEFCSEPNFASRFLNEAKATNQVRHPGIVEVTDMQRTTDGTLCIVMEYLEGETLSVRLEQACHGLATPEALRIAQLLASALAFAHDKGVIHRDLKPSNVMIVPDPDMPGRERTKIMDFGIAKLRPSDPSEDANTDVRTASTHILGTYYYMAPEQTYPGSEIDGKVDVYALGILLFQMLSGRLPFQGDPPDVISAHRRQTPPEIAEEVPHIPAEVSELIRRMLAKSATDRPDMATIVQTLQQILDTSVSALGEMGRMISTELPRPILRTRTETGPIASSEAEGLKSMPAGRLVQMSSSPRVRTILRAASLVALLLAVGSFDRAGLAPSAAVIQTPADVPTFASSTSRFAGDFRPSPVEAQAMSTASRDLGAALTAAIPRSDPPKRQAAKAKHLKQTATEVKKTKSPDPSLNQEQPPSIPSSHVERLLGILDK